MDRISRFLLASAAGLALLAAPVARADLIIDSFTTGAQTVTNSNPSTTVGSGVAAGGAIGGARFISVSNGASIFNSDAIVTPALGRLDFASQVSPPLNSSSFFVKYDGSTGSALNATGLGGIDVSGNTGIDLLANNTSNGRETVTFTLYTDATNFSTGTINIPSGASNLGLFLSFASFSVGGGTGVNLSSLGAMTVAITYANLQGSSGSLQLVKFGNPVPEPSSLALGAIALVTVGGIGGARRRRKSTPT